jgi:diguanylate cyclase (GGDEF)-like protein
VATRTSLSAAHGAADAARASRARSASVRTHAWAWTLAACALPILVYPFLPGDAELVVYHLVGLVAVVGIVAGVRMQRLPPVPWLLLAAGQLAFVVGDTLWDVYDRILHTAPSPSPADVLYLAGYPLMAAALALLAHRRAAAGPALLDAAIVTIGVAVVSWVFVIAPLATDTSVATVDRIVAVAYPVGDLLLLAMTVRLFLAPGRASRGHRLLGTGLLVVLVADALYAQATLGATALVPERFLDTGWLAGYALIGAAVLVPTIRALTEPPPAHAEVGPSRLWLLAGASLLAPATLALQTARGADAQPMLIALTSAVLFGLVVLRMSWLVRRVEEQAAELSRAARTDALTGAPNRRAWDEQIAIELARAKRTGAPVSVAMLDLDHFKAYNDRHGHPAGDRLLRAVTDAWRAQLRTIDVLARYGGEEFGLILPGCGVDLAAAIVERLRLATPGGESSSAGVAAWDGIECADTLLARTDQALYAAKHAGRDRTVVAHVEQLAA